MQRWANLTLTLSCPRCTTELVVTLDDVHAERTIRCARCGVTVPLAPERVAPELAAMHDVGADAPPMWFQP
jgi:predicted Zn finger-like uncharacterized protein